ncbi:uncharacterized protein LOC129565019 [Sitodiplosis mosellana]|uniref:uncharacterized protein LOC129565019 n=1 Tax=Sitodiplosis mosellana TaxID=263140 RepID=UPI002443F6ED|nr:uncharacterized protein LOC129565019 [Sitodiplosis mosellana]
MNKSRKTISKETQEAIKQFLSSNVSRQNESPATPKTELDANFSRILQKKREEQLEASRLRLYNSTVLRLDSTVEASHTEKKSESLGSMPVKRAAAIELENSMMVFSKVNKSWNELSDGEDSFLALERQCNMDDKRDQLINANDTLLFDVEPPSELWNQTINQTLVVTNLNNSEIDDDTIEISPAVHIGVTHPSTIIEETSSQIDSASKSVDSSSSARSSFNDTASTIETVKELSTKSCDTSKESNLSGQRARISPLTQQNTKNNKVERQRRGTFAFKRANYTFFPDENLMPINESIASKTSTSENVGSKSNGSKSVASQSAGSQILTLQCVTTPNQCVTSTSKVIPKLIDIDIEPNNAKNKNNDEDDEDQFNNTLERVDYLLEKGKQILDETPVAKRSIHHNSQLLETPLFSCKRKRLLSEMAAEMLPLPKRGPLIDFSTPEVTGQSRFSKLARK